MHHGWTTIMLPENIDMAVGTLPQKLESNWWPLITGQQFSDELLAISLRDHVPKCGSTE